MPSTKTYDKYKDSGVEWIEKFLFIGKLINSAEFLIELQIMLQAVVLRILMQMYNIWMNLIMQC